MYSCSEGWLQSEGVEGNSEMLVYCAKQIIFCGLQWARESNFGKTPDLERKGREE